MAPREKERRFVEKGSAGMAQDEGRPGEVDRHVVAGHRVRVDVAGAGEDGRSRVDQDRPFRFAGETVDVRERGTVAPVGVRGHLHVGRVELDRAQSVFLEQLLRVLDDVARVPRVNPSHRNEPVAVALDVPRNPGVHDLGDPEGVRRNRVDEGGPRDAFGIHHPEEVVGRVHDPPEEVQIVPSVQHDAAGAFVHPVVRPDVDVRVENRHGGGHARDDSGPLPAASAVLT